MKSFTDLNVELMNEHFLLMFRLYPDFILILSCVMGTEIVVKVRYGAV